MFDGRMNIDELADAAGLSRRAIRFYVQQKLLPAPIGAGRGSHYDAAHLERLKQLQQLQDAGHSLDSIRRILNGETVAPPTPPRAGRTEPALSAELWTRLRLSDGVELHLDTARHNPDVAQLLALRDAIRAILNADNGSEPEQSD